MSYTKKQTPAGFDAAAAVTALINANHATAALDHVAQIVAAGSTVTLSTGQTVWCSCVVCDVPETQAIDLVTLAIQLDGTKPRTRPSGAIVGVLRWCQCDATFLTAIGLDTLRKARLMLALGEPQPQVDGHDVFEGVDAAAQSIATHIAVADALDGAPAVVL